MNLVPRCTLGLATRTIYGRALHAPSLCKLKAVAASYFSRDTRIDFQFVAVVKLDGGVGGGVGKISGAPAAALFSPRVSINAR